MVAELKAILDLLGDITQIGGWVFGGWIIFKAVILLSTTGAIVYVSKLGIERITGSLNKWIKAKKIIKLTPEKVIVKEVKIHDMSISHDGTYDHIVESLRRVRAHVDTAGGKYIHTAGAEWLRTAVEEKMVKDYDEKAKAGKDT